MKILISILAILLSTTSDASNRRIMDKHGKTIFYITRDTIRTPSGRKLLTVYKNNITLPSGISVGRVR